MVSTININPCFQLHSANRTNQSSSKIGKPKHYSSSSSHSRSRSPPTNRQVIISTKHHQENQIRKAQREKLIREKELIFKRQSSSISHSKSHRSASDRRESKTERLKRLYKQYSDEDVFKHWKPLSANGCFELYQHAFEKYYRRS